MPATVIKAGVAQPTVLNPRLSYMTEKICKEITAEFSGREVHDMWSNCGTVQEVPFIVERDIVVEVPEVHIIKVVNETPVYEEVDICTEVLVPEVIHKEVILEMHVEGTEIVEKPVNQWTIRETEKPAVVTRVIEECELLVDVPIVVPTVERVIERPIVTVDCKVHQVTGCVEKIVGETEVVEDRYVVDVPKVVPVPVEKIIIEPVEKVVQHIRRIEKIVEVPQEQTFQKIVEVPQINTKTTIRHVPKFVDNGYRSVMTKTAEDCAEEELHTARFLIQELELQKAQLRCQLELRQRQIAESDVTIECELRTRRQLEEQLERISGCFGREFKYCGEIVSPGNCTTIIKDVIVETVTVDVDPRRQTVVTEEDKIVVQTYGISGNPQGATNCEWMFGDAATGLLGFNALAGLNPLRWSGAISISKAISDLRSVQAHQAHQSRPIVLKAPAGVFAKEQRFTTSQAAIDYLESLVPAETRSTQVVTRTTLPAQAVASAPVRMQNIVYAK